MTAAVSLRPAFDRLAFAKQILHAEATAIGLAADRLGESFLAVIECLSQSRGRVAVSGVGKSADVAQKLVGTFNSTGTRSYLLDATKAVHGDLGMVAPDDVAILFSHSGESEEIVRLLPSLRSFASAVIGITGTADGRLAKAADASIVYGPLTEACPNQLAPSSSTTVMLALGDAIAFTLCELREFRRDDFAKFHPAGSLGRKLLNVEHVMRQGDELRIAAAGETVRSVFATGRHVGRRTGAIMLIDDGHRLCGLFTDSDLAKIFEQNRDTAFDEPIANVMTRTPITIAPDVKVVAAIELMHARKISELPVVDADGRPVGMIDITDVIGLELPSVGPAARPKLRLVERIGG